MAAALPVPNVPFFDPITKTISVEWQNFFLAIEAAIPGALAPIDARYLTATSNTTLTNDVNLGALTTGFLYGTVAAGIATLSSKAAVALATEVSGDLPLANLAPAAAASTLLGRGSAAGAGDWEAVTLGANLTMTNQVLAASGGGSPGGSTTQVQFNNAGAFGGDAGLVYDQTTDILTLGSTLRAKGVTTTGLATVDTSADTLTLTNNATQTIAGAGVGAFLFIYEGTQTGAAALFAFYNSGEAIVWQSGTSFSTVIGTAAKVNVAAVAGVITIENTLGGTAGIKAHLMRLS